MSTYYFQQYPHKGNKKLHFPWYWTNEWQHYPKLFNRGYAHFKNVINAHNRRYPTDPWPMYDYNKWKPFAEYHAKQRYLQRRPNKQMQIERFNKKFYNHMLWEYGAWPTYKNPKYLQLYPHQITPLHAPFIEDIKPLKREYLLQRIGIAAARAWDKTHNKNKKVNK